MAIEKVYSVPQAAEITTLSKWTIWAMLTRGQLKRTKIGGRTVIRESELMKLIKDQE
jgi:excisionase family DNA binding protein